MNDFDFNFDFDVNIIDEKSEKDIFGLESDFIKIKVPVIDESYICYENAEKLAKEMGMIKSDERIHVMVSGSFIFGDFLEAWIVENNLWIDELTISTLSASQDNFDSINNLIEGEFVEQVNLLLSDYFYAHERRNLIPYLFETLNKEKTQVAFADLHTKIILIRLNSGEKIIINGSANLRSSATVETFNIEMNDKLYDFHYAYHRNLLDRFAINKKSIRGKKTWQAITDTIQTKMATQ